MLVLIPTTIVMIRSRLDVKRLSRSSVEPPSMISPRIRKGFGSMNATIAETMIAMKIATLTKSQAWSRPPLPIDVAIRTRAATAIAARST